MQSAPTSLSVNLALYANSDANNPSREWIMYTTQSVVYTRTFHVNTPLYATAVPVCCTIPYYYTTPSTYSTHNSHDLIVDVVNFGLDSTTTLNIKLRVTSASGSLNIIYNAAGYKSYPFFTFYF